MVTEIVLACVLRQRLKKGRQLFGVKSAPPEKILATPMISQTYILQRVDLGVTSVSTSDPT